MGVCAVFDCKNDSEKKLTPNTGFHSFPHDETLIKQWLRFCRPNHKLNTKTAKVCNLHFKKEDFENLLKYEMGFVQSLKLKKGSVPTLRGNTIESKVNVSQICRDKRMLQKQHKKSSTSLKKESSHIRTIIKSCTTDSPMEEPIKQELELKDEEHSLIKLEFVDPAEEVNALKNQILDLKKENFLLKDAEEVYKHQILSLQKRLAKSKYERSIMEKKLNEFLRPGQIKNLRSGLRRHEANE